MVVITRERPWNPASRPFIRHSFNIIEHLSGPKRVAPEIRVESLPIDDERELLIGEILI